MIDLHCHLHYGVDDGPKTAAESLDLARSLLDHGVTKVACTSHLRRDKEWVNDIFQQQVLKDRLDDLLQTNDIHLEYVAGAEHYIDELLLGTCEKKEVVPYGQSNWLLIETPYWGEPPRLLDLLFKIRKSGYRIVLAHVERFDYLHKYPEKLESLISAGYVLQVNLGSIAGMYHKDHKKAAINLVVEGFAGIVAGDCHRAKDVAPAIGAGRKALIKLVGEAAADILMVKNPQKILSGEAVMTMDSYL